ncbi:hypothetical protein [Alicyclobacillus fastidiosus]|uniref:Pectate lyase superfamily protein domain-containing protein n=1 Tax=Alicyclobacillus fastidiosus TaxID=392011 RepID=A0ABV5AAE0_9BACL|nr:hypothetical protein [Alicyclobacillus fastidiosus]WEH07620.1 hypothetical protein PYS47_12645 [Alicyclobacillus fastidiosus]
MSEQLSSNGLFAILNTGEQVNLWPPTSPSSGGGGDGSYVVTAPPYNAATDGITDDSVVLNTIIQACLTGSVKSMVFPAGRYRIASNMTFPDGIQLAFAVGADLVADAGVTVTINSLITAGPFQIFAGNGTFTTSVHPKYHVLPEWFGAAGSGNQYTAAIKSGSNQVQFSSVPDLKVGQVIRIMHGGSLVNLPIPSAPPVLTFQDINGNPLAANGSTTYEYQYCLVTKTGAITGASPLSIFNGGPPSLDLEHEVKIDFSNAPSTGAYPYNSIVVYGAQTNPSSSQGVLYWMNGSNTTYIDSGRGSVTANAVQWIPSTPPADNSLSYTTLVATVTGGEGTTVITIDQNCGNTLSSALIVHDDTQALQNANNFLSEGGVLELRSPQYNVTVDPTSQRALTIGSNVHWLGAIEPKPTLQTWLSPGFDGGSIVLSDGASGWTFEGIAFDAGCVVDYGEYPYGGIAFRGTCNNWQVKNCEFRYLYSKSLDCSGTDVSNWEFSGNYVHHLNSNAIGVGGSNFLIRDNLFDTTLLSTQPNHDGTGMCESIIGGSGASLGIIANNRILNWGPISLVDQQNSPLNDIQIIGNHLEMSVNVAVLALGGGLIGLGGNGNANNIVISGNVLKSIGSGTMIKALANNMTIDSNVLIGSTSVSQVDGQTYTVGGIQVAGGTNVTVSNNTVVVGGIQLMGNYGSISGNTLSSNVPAAITLQGSYGTVTGNTSDPRGSVGCDVEGTFCTVSGNTLNSCRIAGSDIVLTGNTCGEIFFPGGSGSNFVISSNRIMGNVQFYDGNTVTMSDNIINGSIVAYSGLSASTIANNQFNPTSSLNINVDLANPSQVRIVDNTFNMSNVTQCAIRLQSATSLCEIYDNSFTNVRSGVPAIQDLGNNNRISYNKGVNPLPTFSPQPPSSGTWTLGSVIYQTNPVPGTGYVGWICTTAGTANNTPWKANTAYAVGQLVNANGNVYQCAAVTGSGLSGSTPPSGTSSSIQDNQVRWQYVSALAVFKTFGAISG